MGPFDTAWGERKGRQEGVGKGLETAARNVLAEGASVDFVRKITGLDIKTIEALQAQ